MKNHKIIILIVVICLGVFLLHKNSEEKLLGDVNHLVGDVDGNGIVGTNDYLLIKKHILKMSILTGSKLNYADIDGNGIIGISDYLAVKKIILGDSYNTKVDYIEGYFLNIYNNNSLDNSESTGGDAFIFKTSNDKYILLDTGVKSNEIKDVIYNSLKKLQKTDNVMVDYMILSHMHNDHYGNANGLLNDSKIKVNNLIIKSEVISTSDESIIAVAKRNQVNVIDTNVSVKEGDSYTLSNNVKMYLFNTKDIYKSSDICEVEDYTLSFINTENSTYDFVKTKDNMYIYFNGKDYINNGNKLKFYTTDKLEIKIDENDRINSRFYVVKPKDEKTRSQCSSNANSITVVFQIKTDKGNKYIYLPSDLENDGYNPLGEKDENYNVTIHGYISRFYYEYEKINGSPRFIVNDNKLVESTKIEKIQRPQEYLTAKKVKEKFSDLTNNITVYQQSHHAINNSKEAIELLNLNRESVYAISPSGFNPKKSKYFQTLESEYNLRNANIIYVGGNSNNGVKCTIDSIGSTKCARY